MKIATWNVNSINARVEQVLEFMEKHGIDVMAVQETKADDSKFPWERLDYNVVHSGQKAYNGVAIISKYEIGNVVKDFDNITEEARLIMGEVKGIRIMSAYFPHGKMIGSDSFMYKLEFMEKLGEFLKDFVKEKFIIMGDFNVAMEEKDVYNPDIMQYSIGFSIEERKALKRLYEIGFTDLFRLCNPDVQEYTWWDYRANSFKRNAGMRIDYIWASKDVAEKCVDSYVAKEMRAKEKPSDHAPVVAEIKI